MKFHHVNLAYNRNGVRGCGFYVVLFDWRDGCQVRRMVASVFPERGALSVFDRDELNKGNIDFAMGNSWRGDDFEPELRAIIARHETAKFGSTDFGVAVQP